MFQLHFHCVIAVVLDAVQEHRGGPSLRTADIYIVLTQPATSLHYSMETQALFRCWKTYTADKAGAPLRHFWFCPLQIGGKSLCVQASSNANPSTASYCITTAAAPLIPTMPPSRQRKRGEGKCCLPSLGCLTVSWAAYVPSN